MVAPQPTLAQLRPALQLALETAMVPGPPRPGRVRNVVRARRLPPNWPATMARALGEDDAFRAEVAAAATEERLGRIGWLWLTRPEGWEAQLADALEKCAEDASTEEAARRADERLAELEGELVRARSELTEAGRINADLAARLAESDGLANRLRSDLASAGDRAGQQAQELASRDRLIRRLEADNAELRLLPDRLETRLAGLHDRLAAAEASRLQGEQAAAGAADEARAADERARVLSAELVRVRRAAGDAVRRAQAAHRLVGEAVAAAADVLDPGRSEPAPGARSEGPGGAGRRGGEVAGRRGGDVLGRPAGWVGQTADPGSGPPRRATPSEPVRRPGAGRPPRRPGPGPGRRPVALPPAVFEDSPEAAAHLIRTVGVHLIVDGYNVAFRSWPGGDLPALRARLVDALSELAVRVKQTVTVVFDGAAEGGRVPVPAVARPWLRVLFSASTEEADEVIVAAVGELPAEVAVAVATDDRQVRHDARALGANVITVDQLLSVLGRWPGSGRG